MSASAAIESARARQVYVVEFLMTHSVTWINNIFQCINLPGFRHLNLGFIAFGFAQAKGQTRFWTVQSAVFIRHSDPGRQGFVNRYPACFSKKLFRRFCIKNVHPPIQLSLSLNAHDT